MRDKDQQLIWEAFKRTRKKGIFLEDIYELQYEELIAVGPEDFDREWFDHHEHIDGADRRYFTREQLNRLERVPGGYDTDYKEPKIIYKGDPAMRDETMGGDTVILFVPRGKNEDWRTTDQLYLDEYIDWSPQAIASSDLDKI